MAALTSIRFILIEQSVEGHTMSAEKRFTAKARRTPSKEKSELLRPLRLGGSLGVVGIV